MFVVPCPPWFAFSCAYFLGTCTDMRTRVPSISPNQCGVFSGTMMKSPFAILRDSPPSMPVPARLPGWFAFRHELAAGDQRAGAFDDVEHLGSFTCTVAGVPPAARYSRLAFYGRAAGSMGEVGLVGFPFGLGFGNHRGDVGAGGEELGRGGAAGGCWADALDTAPRMTRTSGRARMGNLRRAL